MDKRCDATLSISLPVANARPGAAMWMPSTTVPLPTPCTDRASSISVVLESSIENACTAAMGSVSLIGGAARPAGKAWPFGNWSNRKRFQWNW